MSSSATYRSLLRTPGAAAFFLTAAAGRVGIAMTSLGLVWLIRAATGSYATAGLVTGAFAMAEAIVGPQLARPIDRFGQSRALPPILVAHGGAVAGLMLLVAVDAAPGFLVTAGALVGATMPQLGALSGARWAALLREERAPELPTAFALESVSNAVAFLVGPVLVSTLGGFGHPAVGTGLAAALVVGGGSAFAAQRRTSPPVSTAEERTRAAKSLLRPGFLILVGLHLAIGCYFGAMQVSLTAFPAEHGAANVTGLVFLVSSCSGLLSGWLYGLRRWRPPAPVQLAVATGALTVAAFLVRAADSPLQLGFLVVLTGAGVPPILVLLSVLTDSTVRPAVLTQAFTWQNSASAAGTACAAAVAGWAVDGFGADGGFTLAVGAAALMAVVSIVGRRAFDTTRDVRPASPDATVGA